MTWNGDMYIDMHMYMYVYMYLYIYIDVVNWLKQINYPQNDVMTKKMKHYRIFGWLIYVVWETQ